LEKEKKQRK